MKESGRNRFALLTLAVSIALSLSCACSSPTRQLSPEEVLYRLLSIPSIPLPPETPENEDNPAFLVTLRYCQSVARGRKESFDSYFETLIEEEVPSEAHDDTLFWEKSWADSYWTLWVVPSDTLVYRIDYRTYSYYIEGWIAPGGKSGAIESLTWGYVWATNEAGVGWEYRSTSGMSCDVADSTNGGGYIDVADVGIPFPIYTHIFNAHWDAFGHGTSTEGDW